MYIGVFGNWASFAPKPQFYFVFHDVFLCFPFVIISCVFVIVICFTWLFIFSCVFFYLLFLLFCIASSAVNSFSCCCQCVFVVVHVVATQILWVLLFFSLFFACFVYILFGFLFCIFSLFVFVFSESLVYSCKCELLGRRPHLVRGISKRRFQNASNVFGPRYAGEIFKTQQSAVILDWCFERITW